MHRNVAEKEDLPKRLDDGLDSRIKTASTTTSRGQALAVTATHLSQKHQNCKEDFCGFAINVRMKEKAANGTKHASFVHLSSLLVTLHDVLQKTPHYL